MSRKKNYGTTALWPKRNSSIFSEDTDTADLFRKAAEASVGTAPVKVTEAKKEPPPEYVYYRDKTFLVVCRLPKKRKVRLCIRNRGQLGMVTRDVPESETSTASMAGDLTTVGIHPNHP